MTQENNRSLENEKVLYTDGRDVVVTPSTFKVRNTQYTLSGITKHSLMILKPERWPGLLLLLLGLALAVCGLMAVIPPKVMDGVNINGNFVSANTLALWTGAVLTLIGILILTLVRERYAVRIGTAEGEKDAIVSPKKEYIKQIVDALNKAIGYNSPQSGTAFYTPVSKV